MPSQQGATRLVDAPSPPPPVPSTPCSLGDAAPPSQPHGFFIAAYALLPHTYVEWRTMTKSREDLAIRAYLRRLLCP